MRDYLKSIRKKSNFTQGQVASKLDISDSYYNMIENGSRQKNMDLAIMVGLANVFGVPVEVIISEEQQMKQQPNH